MVSRAKLAEVLDAYAAEQYQNGYDDGSGETKEDHDAVRAFLAKIDQCWVPGCANPYTRKRPGDQGECYCDEHCRDLGAWNKCDDLPWAAELRHLLACVESWDDA